MDALQTNALSNNGDESREVNAPVGKDSLTASGVELSTVTMTYPATVIRRAQRAVVCSPFFHKLLAEMRVSSVSVPTIAEDSGALKGYTQQPLSEVATESELMWLVSVGILRREVDGQGLTDSFRLTPLGRRVVELWQSTGCPDRRASLVDYIKNGVVRWCRVPDWLG